MLTFKDYEEIENRVREIVKEETKHLPTKDDYYNQTDKIIGRLDKIDKNVAALTHRSKDHADRLEKVENHLGLATS